MAVSAKPLPGRHAVGRHRPASLRVDGVRGLGRPLRHHLRRHLARVLAKVGVEELRELLGEHRRVLDGVPNEEWLAVARGEGGDRLGDALLGAAILLVYPEMKW